MRSFPFPSLFFIPPSFPPSSPFPSLHLFSFLPTWARGALKLPYRGLGRARRQTTFGAFCAGKVLLVRAILCSLPDSKK